MIQGWTEQRDALLREIGIYTIERDTVKKESEAQGLALADLHIQIGEARGRIAELTALEERYKTSVSTEVSVLEVRKSRLEGECTVLEERAKGADEKYAIVTMATNDLQIAHDTMKDQSMIVSKVVGEIIQTSQIHTSDMKSVMEEIRTISTEVIDKSNKNITQADIVLNKLTMRVIDNQRPIPVRRTYPHGHPLYTSAEHPKNTQ